MLLLSELCTNAIMHTGSGGGTFEVTVDPGPPMLRVEVHDRGSGHAPVAALPDPAAGTGRGLALVNYLATNWGHHGGREGRVVFFELPL